MTHKSRGVVDLASFGDGARRSVALALALTRASQGVLLVDEIESGIHPRVFEHVLAKLIQAASQAQVQVVATTHSLEALDAMLLAAEASTLTDAFATYHLRRDPDGHSVIRYGQERIAMLRDGGLDIR